MANAIILLVAALAISTVSAGVYRRSAIKHHDGRIEYSLKGRLCSTVPVDAFRPLLLLISLTVCLPEMHAEDSQIRLRHRVPCPA